MPGLKPLASRDSLINSPTDVPRCFRADTLEAPGTYELHDQAQRLEAAVGFPSTSSKSGGRASSSQRVNEGVIHEVASLGQSCPLPPSRELSLTPLLGSQKSPPSVDGAFWASKRGGHLLENGSQDPPAGAGLSKPALVSFPRHNTQVRGAARLSAYPLEPPLR